MTLASDLFNLALTDSGVLGVGQTPQAQDTADTLLRCNMMISQWSRRRWLVYHLVDTALVMTGAQSYTVGTGGDFSITRPAQIEGAYIRQVSPTTTTPVDWYLTQLMSREEYSAICLKTMAASPSEVFFYDSDYPTGRIYPWPIPSSAFELHILTAAVLQQFSSVGDTVNLPPEYHEAIYTNLMVRLRMAYRLPADPVLNGLAKASLNTIRKANFQIGRLKMPATLRHGGGGYNIYADRGVD